MNKNHKTKGTWPRGQSRNRAPRLSQRGDAPRHTRLITFLSDFGLSDTYVGVMKGVVASIDPQARMVDLCHDVAPQDVCMAAFLLAGSFAYFPPGTIHVAVVDPTVGSGRPALCVQSGDYFFIGPDNGILSIACYRAGRPKIFLLENESFFLKWQSRTFHARDVFAPAAAHLSTGVPVETMGRKIGSMQRIRMPRPITERGSRLRQPRIRGEVLHVDRFGNLITNIEPQTIQSAFPRVDRSSLLVTLADHEIHGLSATYSDVAPGLALALFGSYNLMEVAVRDGNASLTLGIGRGDRIRIGPGGGAS